ncbi:hypothetical protein HDK77DRAFT_451134, partial [Phyllosticta capitalensis]
RLYLSQLDWDWRLSSGFGWLAGWLAGLLAGIWRRFALLLVMCDCIHPSSFAGMPRPIFPRLWMASLCVRLASIVDAVIDHLRLLRTSLIIAPFARRCSQESSRDPPSLLHCKLRRRQPRASTRTKIDSAPILSTPPINTSTKPTRLHLVLRA